MSALCQELRTDLELPLCMRIVRLLRTLNLINEEQLAVKFLQTRNAWFNAKLGSIPDENSKLMFYFVLACRKKDKNIFC